MTDLELMELAIKARERAYAPYSGFFVGAALLAADGRVFCGCNIENAAYTPTCCAERVALFKAISEGVRELSAIAVAGGRGNDLTFCTPCGVCRQVMAEFCDSDFRILLGSAEKISAYSLRELLPLSFGKQNLV